MPRPVNRVVSAGLAIVVASCVGRSTDPPIARELPGTWQLVSFCLPYGIDPCTPVRDGPQLRFGPHRSVSSSSPAWKGRYRLEVRKIVEGSKEVVMLHLPRSRTAPQVWIEADTLVISYAYVDGGSDLYVRADSVEGREPTPDESRRPGTKTRADSLPEIRQ